MEKTIYQSGMLMVRCHESYKEIKNWLGKIAKDNWKYQSKQLGKISHNNPFIINLECIKRVKNYNINQINTMVQAFSYTTELTQDVMIYMILRVLNDPIRNTQSLQEGINEWKVYVY